MGRDWSGELEIKLGMVQRRTGTQSGVELGWAGGFTGRELGPARRGFLVTSQHFVWRRRWLWLQLGGYL